MIIKQESSEFIDYLKDASNFKGNADTLYIPETEAEIIAVVKECNTTGTQVSVSGMGTGLTGGRVPNGGVILSLEKLNRIISINGSNFSAVVQPGVILSDLQSELTAQNLFYPPDPTEQNASIGGTVATNASGAKSFKYGATRNFISRLRIITSTGEVLNIKRGDNFVNTGNITIQSGSGTEFKLPIEETGMPEVKNASGYYLKNGMDIIDLFIGMEGTLGIITEIELKLLPKPEEFISCVAFFEDKEFALKFIEKARDLSRDDNSLISAMGLEYFNNKALAFIKDDFPQIDTSFEAAVWFEQDVNQSEFDRILELWVTLIEEFNADMEKVWFATDRKEREKFQEFRHAVSWKVNEYITSNNILKVGTDVAVPDSSFINFYNECESHVEETDLNYISYGHFGNSHLHLNMLPKNQEELITARRLYKLICKWSIDLGGTVSAEHGIGKLKREYLLMMYGEETLIKMARIKRVLDPNLILSMGNVFNPEIFNKC